MSKRDNKSRERFLTIIILLISGLGFIAGVFYNNIEKEANALYEDATTYDIRAESMNLFVESLYEKDSELFQSAEIAFMEARTLTIEWQEILVLNLQTDMEKLENATHKRQIEGKLWDGWSLQDRSTVKGLGGDTRILANQLTHRFDYTIDVELWKSYNDTYPILTPIPAVTFINETVGGVSEYLLNQITEGWSGIYFYEFNGSSYRNMLNEPVFEARDLAFQTLQNAGLSAGAASTLGITVSFTTVAVVLSSAMSGRIDKKKLERYISRIRADIQKDESLLSVGRDRLASIGLILALLLALAGFMMTTPAWVHMLLG